MTKLEEARKLYQTANADQRYVLEKLFPELKDSEDERIRKAIIGYIDHGQHYSVSNKEMIAWLEKQGEKIDIANKEYWRGYREGKKEILDKYAELEKQGEQNPAWKPSDEQMSLLEELVKDNNQRYFYTILRSLYEQLKKLKGE